VRDERAQAALAFFEHARFVGAVLLDEPRHFLNEAAQSGDVLHRLLSR